MRGGPFSIVWLISFILVAITDFVWFSITMKRYKNAYNKSSVFDRIDTVSVVSSWGLISLLIAYSIFMCKSNTAIIYGFILYSYHNISLLMTEPKYHWDMAVMDVSRGTICIAIIYKITSLISRYFGCCCQ